MGVGDERFDRSGPPYASRPVVRFNAIGEAWELFKQRWDVWVPAALIVVVISSSLGRSLAGVGRFPLRPPPVGFRFAIPPVGSTLATALWLTVNGILVAGMSR